MDEEEAAEIIRLQKEKIQKSDNRYAVRVRRQFGRNYVQKGLALAVGYAEKIDREEP